NGVGPGRPDRIVLHRYPYPGRTGVDPGRRLRLACNAIAEVEKTFNLASSVRPGCKRVRSWALRPAAINYVSLSLSSPFAKDAPMPDERLFDISHIESAEASSPSRT